MSTITYIAGMHRSGTSALSQLMNILGFHIPGELDTNTHHNASGHWEPVAFVALNTRILHGWGSEWCDLRLPTQEPQRLDTSLARALDAYVTDASAAAPLTVLKDPRVSYTLPLWLGATERLGQRAVVVLPFRHPIEVAQSLAARDAMPMDAALALWLCHMLAAEHASRGVPRCAVDYDALLSDWRSAYAPVAVLTGTLLPEPGSTLAARVDAAIIRSHRHHTARDAQPEHAADSILALALAAYQLFAGDLASAETRAAFDGLRLRTEATVTATGLVAVAHDFAVAYRTAQAIAERDAVIATLHAEIAANHQAAQRFIDNREHEYRAQYADLERKLNAQLDEVGAAAQQASEWFTAQMHEAHTELTWLRGVQAAQSQELAQLQAILAQQAPYVRILRALHFWRARDSH